MTSGLLSRLLPCLDWFEKYNITRLRMDFIAGVTVALVLVPQSMAYAQLAGLPAYYGLYASFLPPLIAALFGSSRQLATGPVAMVSLMTSTALEPLATAGSEQYIAYAILLALLVGIFQFLLGVLRLGLVINFLSHPVVTGFTNAAALIIATSQLSKLFGVTVESAAHQYETVYNVIVAAIHYIHWPTFGLATLAFVVMIVLRRLSPRLPNVLVAVALTTLISWAIGFEKNEKADIGQIQDAETVDLISAYNLSYDSLNQIADQRLALRQRYDELASHHGSHSTEAILLEHQLELASLEVDRLKEETKLLRGELRRVQFCTITQPDGKEIFAPRSGGEATSCDAAWRLRVGNRPIDLQALALTGGGEVVGNVPRGLPALKPPMFETSTALHLFSMAMIISLLGFMEAISIAKAIAARTGQRLDPNQELIGQGLGNMVGSFAQSYAVSGSFSRSAVNLQAGAVTGMSNVFSTVVVVSVLLFMTPLLYHLPQSVLAAIIMMAVVGLVNVKTFVHAWRAQKYDGAIALITFVTTLVFAPHIDYGIMIGVFLSLVLYLLRSMKPAIAMLALHNDGTYRNRARFNLGQCRHIAVIRYAGSLFFANVSYLEDQVTDTVRSMPELRHVLIVANGINELDTSGVDTLETLIDRLHSHNLKVSISGLNDDVLDTLRRTGLLARIGEENTYRNASRAISNIWDAAHEGSDETECPLRVVPTIKWKIADEAMIRKDIIGGPPDKNNPPQKKE
jgi:SulP family sulfate permease